MDAILDWGIQLILFFQSWGTWLKIPMTFFTFLGQEEFYLLVAPAILWCIEYTVGLRLGLFLMVSGIVNSAVKLGFHQPRPYWYSAEVQGWAAESSFGIPSGHSQNAVVVWGSIAAAIGKRWAWVAALLLVLLISFSRMYLGVHFPSDVLLGWIIGVILLWLLWKFSPPVMSWFNKQTTTVKLASAFALSLLMVLFGVAAKLALGSWELPAEWTNTAIANAGKDAFGDPLSISGFFSNSGAFFGLVAGALLVQKYGGFNAGGDWGKRGARFAIGLIGVLLFWRVLGGLIASVVPGGEDLLSYVLRYLRYALTGFWIAGLGPLLFVRLRLAEWEKTGALKSKRRRKAAPTHS